MEQYINVPYKILKKKDISDKAKLIYGLVNGFFTGDFKAGNAFIGRTLGCSVRSVQRAVKELREANLILSEVVVEDGVVKGRILKIIGK